MTVNLSALAGAGQQFFDNNGNPLSGGKLYSYAAGTTTPKTTYTSITGLTAHTNPIVLDSAGRIATGEIWLTANENYKFVLKTSAEVTIATWDNITGINGTGLATNASLVEYDPAGTGAVATTVQNKLRESVSVWDFMTDAQKADVAAGTALVDTLNAFNAAIQSFPDTLDNIFYKQGGTVLVPFGKYYLSGTLEIDRNIVLKGVGAPYGNAEGGSIMVFADNCDGILCVDYRDSPSNKQGSGLVIDGLYLTRKNTGGSVGSGISLKTTARIVNTTCRGFREHGIKIDASTSYSPASNANLWEVHSCQLAFNGQHGLYVKGADANAGAAYNVNAYANSGWGIYDSSFLGNTYVACHSADNTLGAYKADDANARNIFVGCYSESGQPPASIAIPSMIVGGLHAAGYGATDSAIDSDFIGLYSNFQFRTGVMGIGFGQPNTSGVGLSYKDTGGTFGWTFEKVVGRWGYKWANLGTPTFLIWYDRTATPANGYARDLSAENGALGVAEHYFGGSTQMKYRGLGSAAPVSGTYLQGDIIWNSAPTAGGFVGFVCTAGGTPGTWKTFGAISV
jgi:hypothetical protein